MKCINCSKEIESKGTKPKKYCSDACRMQYKRTEQTNITANEQETNKHRRTVTELPAGVPVLCPDSVLASLESKSDEPDELPDKLPDNCRLNMQLVGGTVYNRQAVKYTPDQYDTRPEPLDPTDTPHKGGRGKYTRQDGTEYLFDSRGHSFDLTDGKVYATIDDVQACYNRAETKQEATA